MSDQSVIARWTEHPYTAYQRRGATVEHRVLLIVYDHGVDIEHQVRGDTQASPPAEWTAITAWEVRNGRVSALDRGEVLRE